YIGAFYGAGGYPYEARTVLRHLLGAGFTVRVLPPPPKGRWWRGHEVDEGLGGMFELLRQPVRGRRPQVTLVHMTPEAFGAARRGSVRIGRTMFETDRLPPRWVRACARMHAIWVPSRFNYHTFAASGVDPRKLRVLPVGVDTRLYHPGAAPLPLPGARGFRFLSVFSWIRRKGWPLLVEAYVREFHPAEDVTLVLKTSPGAATVIREFLRSLRLPWERTARIVVDERPLSAAEMAGLYTACHALVLPSRGGGWGLPLPDAVGQTQHRPLARPYAACVHPPGGGEGQRRTGAPGSGCPLGHAGDGARLCPRTGPVGAAAEPPVRKARRSGPGRGSPMTRAGPLGWGPALFCGRMQLGLEAACARRRRRRPALRGLFLTLGL